MATKDLASQTASLVNRSRADVGRQIAALDAESVINLKVAVDDKDKTLALSILDQTAPAEPTTLNPREAVREINRVGKTNLEKSEPMDRVWELIGTMKPGDWKLAWPAIDQQILIALYNEATDSDTDSVSGDQSQEIFDYARQFVTEHAIYQGQLVEVCVPRGPHNTVGIRLNGSVEMVSRGDLTMLDEHVLGMTAMPSLGRIKQLAGIGAALPSHTAPAHEEFTEEAADVDQVLGSYLEQLNRSVAAIATGLQHGDYKSALVNCTRSRRKLAQMIAALEQADL